LQIGRQGIEWFAPFHQQPVARITMPDLVAVTLSGATKGAVKNFQSSGSLAIKVTGASTVEIIDTAADTLNVEVTGASTLKGDLKITGNARFEVTGASKVELTGSAANVASSVSGASKCDLIDFTVHNADMDISGASNGRVNLNGRFDANVSGASNLTWTGNPTMGDIRTSGASNLRRK
ncbi:MAG: DUF2807 domain-containing protein, partial [Dehalococcoidales bacterium]|nr:DUF2807 domain-containing protein [Dehalococcoidales bacterium]